MKRILQFTLLAVLAVFAGFAIAGHPLITPDMLAGFGTLGAGLPLLTGETADLKPVIDLIEKQGRDMETARAAQSNRLSVIEDELKHQAKIQGRAVLLGGSEPARSVEPGWLDTKTGKPVRVLKHGERMAQPQGEKLPSVGRLLRGLVLGGNAPDAAELSNERKAMGTDVDPSGGFTVGSAMASVWIDALRSQMVLSKAGSVSLPMEAGQVSIARVTADPAVTWHQENAALTDTAPTFGRVNLSAKTVAVVIRFSVELAQESENLEAQLQNVVVNAMAGAIDSAGLNGVTTGAAVAPGGIFGLKDRLTVTAIGAPTSWDWAIDGMYQLALNNTPMENIGALIAHPAVWKRMGKLKTGITNDNTPLTMPAEVAVLPKLWTTAAPLTGGTTAAGVIGNWSNLITGWRQQITVRLLNQAFMGSNLQIALVAYARVDFAAARNQSFCTMEGITV